MCKKTQRSTSASNCFFLLPSPHMLGPKTYSLYNVQPVTFTFSVVTATMAIRNRFPIATLNTNDSKHQRRKRKKATPFHRQLKLKLKSNQIMNFWLQTKYKWNRTRLSLMIFWSFKFINNSPQRQWQLGSFCTPKKKFNKLHNTNKHTHAHNRKMLFIILYVDLERA